MRMYTKSQLSLINGHIVDQNSNIVVINPEVISQANALETYVQKSEYLLAQPAATPMPSLDGFERKSIMDDVIPQFTVSTPTLDKKAEDALALMEELDNLDTADNANEMLQVFPDLLEFVSSNSVIDYGVGTKLERIDTPTLGNILELTKSDVIDAVAKCCGLKKKGSLDDDADDIRSMLKRMIDAEESGELEVFEPTSQLLHDVAEAFDKYADANGDAEPDEATEE